MTACANRAAWLPSKQAPSFVVGEAPYCRPAADELVVRTRAVAVNPLDHRVQRLGVVIQHYPAILGQDAAGVVHEVGSDLTTSFQPGDRVIGWGTPWKGHRYAAFQDFVTLKMPCVAKIPDQTKFEDAVVLPFAMLTAASRLFHEQALALELPPGKAGKGRTLLVWGAGSSVGMCGVQLASVAGYEVHAVASKQHHDLIESLGATCCFDREDPDLVGRMVSSLHDKQVVGAFDAISKQETLQALCEVLHRSGGRKLIGAVLHGAEAHSLHGVAIRTNMAFDISTTDMGTRLWQHFLQPALAGGTIKYAPSPLVVGNTLSDVQAAIDQMGQGVRARKLVVTLDGDL